MLLLLLLSNSKKLHSRLIAIYVTAVHSTHSTSAFTPKKNASLRASAIYLFVGWKFGWKVSRTAEESKTSYGCLSVLSSPPPINDSF
jgi:hypothetical protein